MEMKAQVFRDGTSQQGRRLRSQDPNYVSIDEQTLADWIRFAQAYAQNLTYFNEFNQPDGDWSAFFAGDADEMAAAIETLESKADAGAVSHAAQLLIAPEILQTLSQPHLALFLTFLRLLRCPQQQFKALTQRRLDFYYRQVLRLAEKSAIPDQAHVIFTLEPTQTDALLTKGTHLSAGVDQQGKDLTYELDDNLYITQAQVASVKTLSVEKLYIDLRYIHLADQRSDEAFEKMLRWAVGTPSQGGVLPMLPATDPLATQENRTNDTTLSEIIALFREFQSVENHTLENVAPARQHYILNQLCFANLDDFKFCFDVHTRENTKHLPDVKPPTEAEWQQVYRLVEKAYRKKINRDRRTRLQQEHHSEHYDDAAVAFLGLWQLVLGEPSPGDPLPPIAEDQPAVLTELLTELAGANAENTARYIQEQLFLSVADFRKIMGTQAQYMAREVVAGSDDPPNNPVNRPMTEQEQGQWAEVYRLLERAQTRKRQFTYPPIGRTELKAICAKAIADAKPDESALTVPRFHPFIARAQSLTPGDRNSGEKTGVQALGVAITTPVLTMEEGHREITLTLACQADTFNRGLLEDLLKQGERPFAVAISSETGWLSILRNQLTFQVGDFFLESSLNAYGQTHVEIMYQTPETAFEESHVGQYLRFPDGGVYHINAVEGSTGVFLSAVGWVDSSDAIYHYSNLTLGDGGVVITNLELSASNNADLREMRATGSPSQGAFRFKRSDVGSFIVWSDGIIYEIKRVGGTTRVDVQLWGYLPPSGQTQKYDRIVFNAAPTARLETLTSARFGFSDIADTVFTPQDIGTLMTGVNGEIYKLAAFISDRTATITPIGRIGRTPTPQTQIEQYSATGIYLNALQFKFSLDATQPAIIAPSKQSGDTSTSTTDFHTPDPIITVTLEDLEDKQGQPSAYQLFKGFCLEKANVQVSVRELQTLQLRNDRTVLNPRSPFEPFDNPPIPGAALYFSHPEIVTKKLDNLSLNLEWMGLPDSYASHYYAYPRCGLSPQPPTLDNNSFKAQLGLLLNRTWHDIGTRSLFSTATADSTTTLLPLGTLHYDKAQFVRLPESAFIAIPEEPTTEDLWAYSRYFRLELIQPDFQHMLYPLVINKVARAKEEDLVADTEDKKIQDLVVYPPYTPKIKGISLDYQASAEIDLRAETDSAPAGKIFQLHPFGYVDLQQTAQEIPGRYFLLPQNDTEGSLFIGLRGVQPPQSLTLLFQLVSGSGNADLTHPDIVWSYLADDRWHRFAPVDVLADSTNGLVDSGIVHITIPEAATRQNHLLPAGLHWLRATVETNAAAIPDVLAIRTQAVTTTFVDQENDPEHLSQPLEAQSIEALVDDNGAIATIEQPYSSFGGRRQESSHTFYTRVGEHLRHKRRAVTRWDYERLVLEQFPQIYKVKCLTQAEQANAPSAAQVTVVVIPNLANSAPFLPLEPKAPQYLLREIEAYLQSHTSPFVKVSVKNPRYEQIKYRIGVRFHDGYEQGHYLKQLNKELVRFLSPWAYEEQSDISFGSSIHSSAVIHFIETRPYVDYVTNLKLIEQVMLTHNRRSKMDTIYHVNPTNLAQVKQVDSILVSAPEHIIDLITTSDYEDEAFEGIDYMIIGVDFFLT
ncbi:MAG: baseplate J/gp47 family protein [Leptolyngbyaceae cyanobacterium]